MRIALAQLNPTSGDIDGNTEKVIDAIAGASARGADLLVTPEMAIPGYCIGDLVEDAGFLAANERALQRVAAAATSLTAIVGFIDHHPAERNDSGTMLKYNAAAVVSQGRVLQRAHKSLLPNYRYFDDKRYFAPARARETGRRHPRRAFGQAGRLDLRGHVGRVLPVKPLPELAAKGADILVNINASPFYPGKRQERDALIRRHIARLGKPFVYVNTAGAADNGKNIIPFDGESLVYAADGRLLAAGRQFAEELLVVDLDPDGRRRRSRFAPSGANARCTTRWSWRSAITCPRPDSRAPSWRSRAASTRRSPSRSPSMRSARTTSRHSTCRREFNTETTRSIAAQLANGARACPTGSSRFRTSPTISSRCSKRTRTRLRAASRARTFRPVSAAS